MRPLITFFQTSRIRVTHASLYLDSNQFFLTQRSRFLPDQQFWSYWRRDKEMLKSAGVRVFRIRGHWCVDVSTVFCQAQQTPQYLPYFKPNDLRMHWELDEDFDSRLVQEAKR